MTATRAAKLAGFQTCATLALDSSVSVDSSMQHFSISDATGLYNDMSSIT
jgi:hypothetical protein